MGGSQGLGEGTYTQSPDLALQTGLLAETWAYSVFGSACVHVHVRLEVWLCLSASMYMCVCVMYICMVYVCAYSVYVCMCVHVCAHAYAPMHT